MLIMLSIYSMMQPRHVVKQKGFDYKKAVDIRDFGPFMNHPENTFGICIQTVAEFLRYQVEIKGGAGP